MDWPHSPTNHATVHPYPHAKFQPIWSSSGRLQVTNKYTDILCIFLHAHWRGKGMSHQPTNRPTVHSRPLPLVQWFGCLQVNQKYTQVFLWFFCLPLPMKRPREHTIPRSIPTSMPNYSPFGPAVWTPNTQTHKQTDICFYIRLMHS